VAAERWLIDPKNVHIAGCEPQFLPLLLVTSQSQLLASLVSPLSALRSFGGNSLAASVDADTMPNKRRESDLRRSGRDANLNDPPTSDTIG
jgi:hypothetical protein